MHPRSSRRAPLAACVAILSALPSGAAARSLLSAGLSADSTACSHDAHDPSHHNCRRRPRLAFVESGVLLGRSSGAASEAFSPVVGVMEIGVLHGARSGRSRSGWGIGGTGFFGGGGQDFRVALKPRLRYRFSPGFAADLSAGPVWSLPTASGHPVDQGLLATVSLQFGGWLTLRTDVQSRPVPSWTGYGYPPQTVPAGTETGVYVGFAMRNRPGWTATILGTGAVAALFMLVAAVVAGMGGIS